MRWPALWEWATDGGERETGVGEEEPIIRYCYGDQLHRIIKSSETDSDAAVTSSLRHDDHVPWSRVVARVAY